MTFALSFKKIESSGECMAFVSYVIENDKAFKAMLKRASGYVQDLRIPFGLILADFYKSEQAIFKLKSPGLYDDFKGEKDENGLTAYRKKKLRKYGFDYPLLFATGKLANSLLGPNNEGSISKITNLSLVFGTSVPYGIYHQSDSPRKKIPLRKFLFIGPEAPQFANSDQVGRPTRWLAIINAYVTKQMAKEGLHGPV